MHGLVQKKLNFQQENDKARAEIARIDEEIEILRRKLDNVGIASEIAADLLLVLPSRLSCRRYETRRRRRRTSGMSCESPTRTARPTSGILSRGRLISWPRPGL